MSLMSYLTGMFMGLLARAPASDPHPAPPSVPPLTALDAQSLYQALLSMNGGQPTNITPLQLYTTKPVTAEDARRIFAPAKPPRGVVPEGVLAMDSINNPMDLWGHGGFNGLTEGMAWLGFPYLAELAQRTEYRRISETIAKDMTRRWFRLQATGEDDKTDKIKQLEECIKFHKLQEKFTLLALLDGFFGRGHLYIDTGVTDDKDMLKLPLPVDPRMIAKGGLKGIRVVEPMWAYPHMFNANDPLKENFYLPQSWWVMGKEIHRTRLLPFTGREMPDMLKPAYSFAGLSLSQMAKPYVDNWLRTRQSVSDIIHSFSTPVLQTNMGAVLNAGASDQLKMRATLFNYLRDNNNMMILDKTTEDFKNVSAPLGSLDHLQAQSQEHMACLPAGTLVETDRGQVPICEVTTADKVMTRTGAAPVAWSGRTGHTTELIEIRTANGSCLRATYNHPIYLPESDSFVAAERVRPGDRLLVAPTSPTNTASQSCGAAIGGDSRAPVTSAMSKREVSYIASLGRHIEALSQKVSSCIIAMRTLPTTASAIWSYSPDPITMLSTLMMAGDGASIGITYCGPRLAEFAASNLRPIIRDGSTVPRAVAGQQTTVVEVRRIPADEPVYNLEVAPGHLPEFYANGILVHNSAVGIPLVVLLGISPSGLNATSEGELQVWAQFIHAAQGSFYDPHLTTILNIMQLHLFGAIDPAITHAWEPLRELSEEEESTAEKTQADIDAVYINAGVLSPDEIRQRLSGEADSPYQGLDLDTPAPPPPNQEPDPLGGVGGGGPGGPPGGPGGPPGAGGPGAPANSNSAPAGGSAAAVSSGPGHMGAAGGSAKPTDPKSGSRDEDLSDDQPGRGHTRIVPEDDNAHIHVHMGPNDRAHVKLGADSVSVVLGMDAIDAFNPNEPRDPKGEWTAGGGGSYVQAGEAGEAGGRKAGRSTIHFHADPGQRLGGQSSGEGVGMGAAAHLAAAKAIGVAKGFGEEDRHVIHQHFASLPPEKRQGVANKIRETAKVLPKLLATHWHEEKANAINTAGAVRALATGHNPTPEQWKGARSTMFKLAMVGGMMMMGGGGEAHGAEHAEAAGHALEFGSEWLNHAMTEHAAKLAIGVGRLGIGAAAAGAIAAVRKRRPAMAHAHDDDGSGISPEDMQLLQHFAMGAAKSVETLDEKTALQIIEQRQGSQAHDEWNESDHPRGQPDNAGQFASQSGGGGEKKTVETGHGHTAEAPAGRSSVSVAPPATVSRSYARRDPGDGGAVRGRSDGASVHGVYEPSDEFRHTLESQGLSAPTFHELGAGSGQTFAQHIVDSKAGNRFGAAVHVYDPAEYNDMRLFTTPDGTAGFALHGDDIISVFRKPDGPKTAVPSILELAVQQGGRRLDCFDTVLPSFYGRRGFKAVARLPFNDEYAPEGWDRETFKKFNDGRPDVVFMVYDPSHGELYQPGDGETVAEYDDGAAAQHQALAGEISSPRLPPEAKTKYGKDTYFKVQNVARIITRQTELGRRDLLHEIISTTDLSAALNDLYYLRLHDSGELKGEDKKIDKILKDELIRRHNGEQVDRQKRADEYAYMSDDDIYDATKINLSGDSRMKPGIKRQLGLLPLSHIAALQRNGIAIEAVQELPPMSMDHPYAPGMHPAGVFDPTRRVVSVADEVTLPDGSKRMLAEREATLRHEIGHAIDSVYQLSYNPVLLDAIDKGVDRMMDNERHAAAYWLAEKYPVASEHAQRRARASEMFAELYAYAFDDDANNHTTLGGLRGYRRFELFGHAKQVIREKVAEALGDKTDLQKVKEWGA